MYSARTGTYHRQPLRFFREAIHKMHLLHRQSAPSILFHGSHNLRSKQWDNLGMFGQMVQNGRGGLYMKHQMNGCENEVDRDDTCGLREY